jgi:hypothetical protein
MKTPGWLLAPLLGLVGLASARAQEAPPAKGLVTPEARQAIEAGLAYLVTQQAADGSWGTGAFKGNVGITGLAGRALLAAGDRPGRGPRGGALTRAVDYILGQEQKDPPGFFAAGPTHGPMYGQGYAVLFLAEVHGVLPGKARKGRVKECLTRATRLILAAQNREGGWRYQPVPRDADVTVTACQLHALRAARAAGLDVPKEALDRGARYVLSCQDLQAGGGFRYMRQGGPVGFARSAAAVSALYQAGVTKGPGPEKGLAYLRAQGPGGGQADAGSRMHYYYGHYYAAQVMRRAGGKAWEDWYAAVRADLLRPQGDRQADGSWDDHRLSPHYSTAMALLILQSPGSRPAGRSR